MALTKSLKTAALSLISSAVSLGFSVVAYDCMVKAVDLTSALGYVDKVVGPCVAGIACGTLSLLILVFAVIFVIKAVDNYVKQKQNGEKQTLTVLAFVLSIVIATTVLTLSPSAVFGCIGLLG